MTTTDATDDIDRFYRRGNVVDTEFTDEQVDNIYKAFAHTAAKRSAARRFTGEGSFEHEQRLAGHLNTMAAVKSVDIVAPETKRVTVQHFSSCACGFISTHTPDKGLALKAYEQHECKFKHGDAHIEKAQAVVAQIDAMATAPAETSEAAERFALLELK